MTDDKPKKDSPDKSVDLANLANFQFGPAWARSGTDKNNLPRTRTSGRTGEGRPRPEGKDGFAPRGRRPDDRGGRFERKDGDRPFNRGRRDDSRGRSFEGRSGDRNDRGDRFAPRRQREELPEPTEGLRVELRPADALLVSWASEINKHRRVVSLFDFAKIVMAARDRYDIVFMKQEGGPELYHSLKGDGSCWETKPEAVNYIWKAPWFADFYTSVEEEVEAPKGEFQGIAKCILTGDLIGPVNWHGYQSALQALHKSKFSNMTLEQFRHKIEIEKGDEVIQSWLASVSQKTVWKPVREGAEDVVLETPRELEQDFSEHFFEKAFELKDKVFVNGHVAKALMSPGLWSHIIKLADTTRKHPSMLIPNLCHGLARHRMPIFKWKGMHHTGPSRPRVIPEGTVLADRMSTIVGWVKAHPGARVEAMLNDLGGSMVVSEAPVEKKPEEVSPEADVIASVETTPEVAQEADTQAASVGVEQKRHDLVSDLLWLCEQGFVLVFTDGTVNIQQQVTAAPSEKGKNATGKTASPKSKEKKAKAPRKVAKPKKKEEAVAEEEANSQPVKASEEAEQAAEEVVAPAPVEAESSVEVSE